MKKMTQYVDLSSPKYEEIEKMIRETYENSCIVWIEKCENKELQELYDTYYTSLLNSNIEPNVKTLFHGTSEASARSIISNGIDTRYKKRCAFGQGIYFSTRAVYSKDYTKKSSDDISFMLLCDVILGKTTTGTNIPEGYHSLTDNLRKPDMYIVNKKESVLPKYLVAFYI